MFDVITLGSSTVDIFVKPKDNKKITLECQNSCNELICFEYGGKLDIEEVHECFGGGGTNTGIGFSRLGLKTAVCTVVGEDEWGGKIRQNLKNECVSDDFINTSPATKTGFSIILNSFTGDRTVLYFAGTNKKFQAKHIPKNNFKTKWLFINRLASTEEEIIFDLIVKMKKKNKNIKIAWNPGGNQIKNGYKKYSELLKNIDVLILNKEESASFIKEDFDYPKSHESIVLDLAKDRKKIYKIARDNILPPCVYNFRRIFKKAYTLGPKNIVITDGKRGAQAFDGKYVYFCPVITLDRKDTLGAGDAFSTGFTYAIIQGLSLQIALKFGTINATSVVNFYGAQNGLLSKRQLQEFYEKNSLTTLKIPIQK